MRGFGRRSGGNPWASHGQPRRSYSPAQRYHGGGGGTGSSPGGRNGGIGEIGMW